MALPIEIRHQTRSLDKQGLRAKGIANRLGIGRSPVRNWQHRYDRGDDLWLTQANDNRRQDRLAGR